ncbi:MAG: hypothetical protein ABEJ65_02365, partial [bacterium]
KKVAKSDPAYEWEGGEKVYFIRDECKGAIKQIKQRGGGWCVIERTGTPESTLESLRSLRDVALNTSVGRWMTQFYYHGE